MDRFIAQDALAVGRGGMVRIESGRGTLLHVREGALWITQQGDARDYYVRAGEKFRVRREGTVLAQALENATLSVAVPSCAPASRPATAAL